MTKSAKKTQPTPTKMLGRDALLALRGAPENLTKSGGSSNLGGNALVELIGQEFNVGVSQGVSGRPCDARIPNRPDLRHQGRKFGREFPETDDSPGDERTHDVNDEMLAEEDRRGLRVRSVNRFSCNDLGFLFGV